jgi:di/tricarboxylate transporter
MGVAVARSGLAERLARRILARARGRPLRVYVQLVLAMPVLTLILPSATTRSGILVHIYEEVFGLARVPAGAPVVKAVMLALTSIYERGHVTAGEIFRFGLWMTAVAYAVILLVALPYWGALGEPLRK